MNYCQNALFGEKGAGQSGRTWADELTVSPQCSRADSEPQSASSPYPHFSLLQPHTTQSCFSVAPSPPESRCGEARAPPGPSPEWIGSAVCSASRRLRCPMARRTEERVLELEKRKVNTGICTHAEIKLKWFYFQTILFECQWDSRLFYKDYKHLQIKYSPTNNESIPDHPILMAKIVFPLYA